MTAFSLYMTGVRLIGPSKASLYACVEPIAATLLSAVWLKVPFQAIDLAGFGLIIATILILAAEDVKKQKA
jgi:drug/metabolite transporter (DMT)-like permease